MLSRAPFRMLQQLKDQAGTPLSAQALRLCLSAVGSNPVSPVRAVIARLVRSPFSLQGPRPLWAGLLWEVRMQGMKL